MKDQKRTKLFLGSAALSALLVSGGIFGVTTPVWAESKQPESNIDKMIREKYNSTKKESYPSKYPNGRAGLATGRGSSGSGASR